MKKISILIAMTLLLGLLAGCDDKSMVAPELLKPVAVNEAYRTVAYGDVGDFQWKNGKVVPTDYCHFWKTRTAVSEIKVDIGQYVEEGQVLAVADIESAQEMLDSIVKEKELSASIYEMNCNIYEAKKQELNYRLLGYQALSDAENINSTSVEIAVLDENHSYDVLLYEYNVASYDEDIAKYEEIISDGTLVAKKSGYVSYIKDLSKGSDVENYENVVIVSDYEDCYVEISDAFVGDKMFYYYPICYTILNGEKYNLKEYEYKPEELIIVGNREISPCLRVKFENEANMPELGSSLPIFFQKDIKENVLYVGNDSLYTDDGGSFVYVYENGEHVKRYVETGVTDKVNTEILEGIAEGELVFYSSESVLPENYEEVSVVSTDFDVIATTKNCQIDNTRTSLYLSEYTGNVKEVYVNVGDYVEEGDLICAIDTGEPIAALVDMENRLNSFKASYGASITGYDNQISDLEEQKNLAIMERDKNMDSEETSETLEMATVTDAVEEEPQIRPYIPEEIAYQIEQVKLEKQIYELEYASQLESMETELAKAKGKNDGTGASNVYAHTSGFVDYVKSVGSQVEYGDRLLNIETESDNKVLIYLTGDVALNQAIEIKDEITGKIYEGRVSALSGTKTSSRVYLFTENDETYVTTSKNTEPGFYAWVEDEGFYESDGDYSASYATTSIKQTVVVPSEAVYVEYPTTGNELYYVWKIENEQLVKQYVEVSGYPMKTSTALNDRILEGDYVYCIIKGLKPGDVVAALSDEE